MCKIISQPKRICYNYNHYIKYHLYCCEKPEHLGKTNHTLFVLEKRD